MNTNENNILTEFKKIANKGWIKSVSNSTGSIGITFEKELGNKENSSFLPDYQGIEIKCSSMYARYPITLFTSALDGPSNAELIRITEKYGYNDNIYKDKKILYLFLNCKTKYKAKSKYYFQLELNHKEEKLYLLVYDINNNLIEKISYINFSTIYKHLNIKLKKLALIYGKQTNKNNEKYFKYYKINIYHLKDFKTFLNLIENNTICISLISRINKSKSNGGKYKNKNLIFAIKRENIELLFDKIYSYEEK